MIRANQAGDMPRIDDGAYVCSSAIIVGKVEIGSRVFVGPNAVIRADEPGPDGRVQAVIVRDRANIQDGVIVHALGGSSVIIGKGASLAHGAVVHGPCLVGEDCFIGFNSVVFKASLGDGVIVMHLSLVEGVEVPPRVHVPSMSAVRSAADVSRLAPPPAELVGFAGRVRDMNVVLTEAAHRPVL
ncbi:MAG: hypothetical protein MUF52_13580 [Syntrophobacteraceae bacterium]|jgi:carbonic anhydrase/acetyltransferase-like protein (isoleucine patch superfamily)|nr:hypothetical protein [Syntrophobacteraceae bacterium]